MGLSPEVSFIVGLPGSNIEYDKKTVRIGKHRSCYEKIVEEAKRYHWIDFVANYKNLVFEPKDIAGWLGIKKLVAGDVLGIYGKSLDKLHEKDVHVALDNLTKMLGREIKTSEKIIFKGQPKIKRAIVNCDYGLHVRPISEMIEAIKPYVQKGGSINMIYGEEIVSLAPDNILTVMALGIEKGSELIFEFYGEGYEEPYSKIAKVLNCPIFYKNNDT